MPDRTPTDYALEHAEYLAQAAEGFIDECNELAKAQMARDELCGDECEAATKAADEKVWQAKEAISEGMGRLRACIHGFRTRRDRAAVALPHEPADVARAILAADHAGMHVDYSGLLRNAQGCATHAGQLATRFMLKELQGHMAELGRRYYAGDTAVVDEFLQLYCIGREERAALKKGSPS